MEVPIHCNKSHPPQSSSPRRGWQLIFKPGACLMSAPGANPALKAQEICIALQASKEAFFLSFTTRCWAATPLQVLQH